MNVTRLGVAHFRNQDLPWGIIAETDDGRHIVISGGFSSQESATVNVGAILGRYTDLFLYDGEYPIDPTRQPAPYSLRGANALTMDAEVLTRRTYWTAVQDYDVRRWYTHRHILIA